jgi:SHS2 domain-containing protein
MKKFEKIDHTADIGVRAYGKTLEQLFANAASGLISLLFGNNPPEALSEITAEIKGSDHEEMLVNFLEEILYQMNVNRFVSAEAAIVHLEENYLTMRLKGEPLSETKHSIHYDIKGVTFHLLEFEKTDDTQTVQVIFDI